MRKTVVFLLSIFFTIVFAETELFDYVSSKVDISYQIISEKTTNSGMKLIHVVLKSQRWQDIDWYHDVLIAVPVEVKYPDVAVLIITGDFDPTKSRDVEDYSWIADKFSASMIVLGDIPNQPIHGLREDDLIAHTLVEYRKTADPTLPLLFPMTAAAVATMNMAEELLNVKKFFVTGASKRGWTTWLTAVSDDRVFAIAPIVFDMLNFPAQYRQQLTMYGKFSDSLRPYVERGVMEWITEEIGQKLIRMLDPFSYREGLSLPKYIINATNDEYWTIYSSMLYFFDLPGRNCLLYVPNSPHGIRNISFVVDNAASFFKLVLENKLPSFEFSIDGSKITVKHSELIKEVYVWRAVSDVTDFRKSLWMRVPLNEVDGYYVAELDPPAGRHIAYYVEVVFEIDGLQISLCTPGVYR